MRIAYLTARYPFPPIGGDRLRVYYMLRHLLRDHEVTLYTLRSKGWKAHNQNNDFQALRQKAFPMSAASYAWNSVAGFFADLPLQVKLYQCPRLAQTLDADIRRGAIDLLFVHLIRMAEYARPLNSIPRILDMTDSIHLHYTRMPHFSLRPKWVATRIERDRLLRYEADVCSWFGHVLLASPLDVAWLRQRQTGENLTLVPTGVEIADFPFHEGPFDPSRIIFVGKLDYLPNADAAINKGPCPARPIVMLPWWPDSILAFRALGKFSIL